MADATKLATHNITPAFVYSGNTSIWGTTSELYRVAVFTDEDCLNPVFRGAMVGSPAYVPREVGPLAMPVDVNGLTDARGHFLKFGTEPDSKSAEGLVVKTNEMDLAPAGDDSHNGLPAVTGRQLREGRPLGQRLGRRPLLLDRRSGRRDPGSAALDDAQFGAGVPGDTTIDVVDAAGINRRRRATHRLPVGASDGRRGRGHHDHAHQSPRRHPLAG